ncbi:hypothetical protein SEUCBS139899_008462 [Sporothrix eucalyptigena]|uniref:Fungal specific transcription factor n=1 Tax=Sporothrix eucalyptigena TaxID=1812306 RepID=A0ABP0CZN4_9PEZI
MRGLQDSRWAIRDGRSSSVPAPRSRPHGAHRDTTGKEGMAHPDLRPQDLTSAAAELARYSKIVRRMKWKLPFLDLAYRQATSGPAEHGTAASEAELMFKLDFFEYYMLCERALVHLQGVYGITISRGSAQDVRGPSAIDSIGRPSTHRYHANVLEALDRKDNPLHAILGDEDVRRQLGRAKDLRNRWKSADDNGEPVKNKPASPHKSMSPPPLASYDLASILTCIHEALDRAFVFTRNFVGNEASKANAASGRAALADVSAMDMDSGATETEEWGFMVEAMDWDAV